MPVQYNTLIASTQILAMQWMDEVAYITATRFTRMKMVTISCEKVEFKQAINYGSIVEIIGKVVKVGSVRIEIKVEIFIENLDNDNRIKAVDAFFTFAAIDDNHNPLRIDLSESFKQ